MNEGKWHRPYHQVVLQEQEQGPTTDLLGHTGEPLFFYQKQEGFVPQWQLSKTHNIAISHFFFFNGFSSSIHTHKHIHIQIHIISRSKLALKFEKPKDT